MNSKRLLLMVVNGSETALVISLNSLEGDCHQNLKL